MGRAHGGVAESVSPGRWGQSPARARCGGHPSPLAGVPAPAPLPDVPVVGVCLGSRWTPAGTEMTFDTPSGRGVAVLVAGKELAVALSGPRRCVGCAAKLPSGGAVPDGVALAHTGAQCKSCAQETRRRVSSPPDVRHAIYLACFAPGMVKVGIAQWDRRARRLAEQGAPAALVIGARDSGHSAQRFEQWWHKRAGVKDRYPPAAHVRALAVPRTGVNGLMVELRDTLALHAPRLCPGELLHEPEVVKLPEVPVLARARELIRARDGLVIRGRVIATVAQELVIEDAASGRLQAVPLKGLNGWRLRPAAPGECTPTQLSLFDL